MVEKWAVRCGEAAWSPDVRSKRIDGVSKTRQPTVVSGRRMRPPLRWHRHSHSAQRHTKTARGRPSESVNLDAPEIIKAVSELPTAIAQPQAWNPEPVAGKLQRMPSNCRR